MTDGTITIPNWDRFQHYKKKSPPWIKLYRDTLGDYQIMFGLTPNERWILMGLWMLAAETDNAVPRDCGYLSTRLQAKVTEAVLEKLQSVGVIEVGGQSREGLDKLYSQKRREEKRREEIPSADASDFDELWEVAKRGPKAKALEAYRKALTKVPHTDLLTARKAHVRAVSDLKFVVYLDRWLRDELWQQQEVAPSTQSKVRRYGKGEVY